MRLDRDKAGYPVFVWEMSPWLDAARVNWTPSPESLRRAYDAALENWSA